MGLSVVHGIVKTLNGMMSLESEVGQGTTFHVYFRTQSQTIESSPATRSAKPMGKGETILLVDDEEMIVDMTRDILSNLDYRVETSTNSERALKRFSSDPYAYDAVITDHTMPRLTGAELATKMLDIRPDLPIIICTGFSENLSGQRAKALGIREYIMKPIDPGSLASVVRTVLDTTPKTHARAYTQQSIPF
jgi:CheY-like chemotaxis protein